MSGKTLGTIALALLTTLSTHAAEYKIDVAHSSVLFKVLHMGINTVTGRFDSFQGSFEVDPAHVENTKGSAVIETKSINTNNAKRDNHLRGDDFFNADSFPEIRFVSKSVRNVNMADSTCELVGDLTMRDVTKEIVLKVKGGAIIKDGFGNERASFSATGSVNRFDYHLKWSKMIETGAMMGGEESGGFGFGMHLPERDGIYADLLLLDLFLRERAAGRWPASRAIARRASSR